MKKIFFLAFATTAAFAVTAAQASGVAYNSAPADGWFYGSGNNYSPANTAVSTLSNGNQLYLRNHVYQQVAPASDGNGVYSFGTGSTISFDWGIDESGGAIDHSTALITLKNLGTGQTTSYNPFFSGNDNAVANGSSQNSARFTFGFLSGLGFDPSKNDVYRTTLSFSDQDGLHSLSIDAKVGAGVPEPATWAMMLGGFGLLGGAMRRRRPAPIVVA